MDRYKEVVEILTSKEKFHIELGLERTRKVLELLGNPQQDFKCIQVSGTNGKGSVCAMLGSILKEAGYKVGVYTSPHIFEYMERIKINGIDIDVDTFYNYLKRVIELIEKNDIYLTEFEILTVVMFKYFSDEGIDIAILEAGLGGRLDATNVVSENLCSIITHIDKDHTERLGDTKEKIAYEKAGIIKNNSIVITSEGYECIKDKADETNSLLIITTPFVEKKYLDALSLKGIQQQDNLALVLEAVKNVFSDIEDETILNGLRKVKHICRFQYIKEKNLIVDGAHNPNSIEILTRNLDYYYPNTKRQFIVGVLNNKDYRTMVELLFPFKRYEDTQPKIYFYQFNNPNACTFKELLDPCIYFARELKSVEEIEYSADVLTVICGSFYMLSELIDKNEVI